MINKLDLVLLLIFGIILSLFSKKFKISIVSWFLDKFDRKGVFLPGQGIITFFIGIILSLYLFEQTIALASILIMSIGDSIATLIGQYGRIKTKLSKKKTLEGAIAGTIASIIGSSFIIQFHEALIVSIISMLVELKDFKLKNIIDDNILIPLTAGIVLTIIRLI